MGRSKGDETDFPIEFERKDNERMAARSSPPQRTFSLAQSQKSASSSAMNQDPPRPYFIQLSKGYSLACSEVLNHEKQLSELLEQRSTRFLLMRHMSKLLSETRLKSIFSDYGKVRMVERLPDGSDVVVQFYDRRSAWSVVVNLLRCYNNWKAFCAPGCKIFARFVSTPVTNVLWIRFPSVHDASGVLEHCKGFGYIESARMGDTHNYLYICYREEEDAINAFFGIRSYKLQNSVNKIQIDFCGMEQSEKIYSLNEVYSSASKKNNNNSLRSNDQQSTHSDSRQGAFDRNSSQNWGRPRNDDSPSHARGAVAVRSQVTQHLARRSSDRSEFHNDNFKMDENINPRIRQEQDYDRKHASMSSYREAPFSDRGRPSTIVSQRFQAQQQQQQQQNEAESHDFPRQKQQQQQQQFFNEQHSQRQNRLPLSSSSAPSTSNAPGASGSNSKDAVLVQVFERGSARPRESIVSRELLRGPRDSSGREYSRDRNNDYNAPSSSSAFSFFRRNNPPASFSHGADNEIADDYESERGKDRERDHERDHPPKRRRDDNYQGGSEWEVAHHHARRGIREAPHPGNATGQSNSLSTPRQESPGKRIMKRNRSPAISIGDGSDRERDLGRERLRGKEMENGQHEYRHEKMDKNGFSGDHAELIVADDRTHPLDQSRDRESVRALGRDREYVIEQVIDHDVHLAAERYLETNEQHSENQERGRGRERVRNHERNQYRYRDGSRIEASPAHLLSDLQHLRPRLSLSQERETKNQHRIFLNPSSKLQQGDAPEPSDDVVDQDLDTEDSYMHSGQRNVPKASSTAIPLAIPSSSASSSAGKTLPISTAALASSSTSALPTSALAPLLISTTGPVGASVPSQSSSTSSLPPYQQMSIAPSSAGIQAEEARAVATGLEMDEDKDMETIGKQNDLRENSDQELLDGISTSNAFSRKPIPVLEPSLSMEEQENRTHYEHQNPFDELISGEQRYPPTIAEIEHANHDDETEGGRVYDNFHDVDDFEEAEIAARPAWWLECSLYEQRNRYHPLQQLPLVCKTALQMDHHHARIAVYKVAGPMPFGEFEFDDVVPEQINITVQMPLIKFQNFLRSMDSHLHEIGSMLVIADSVMIRDQENTKQQKQSHEQQEQEQEQEQEQHQQEDEESHRSSLSAAAATASGDNSNNALDPGVSHADDARTLVDPHSTADGNGDEAAAAVASTSSNHNTKNNEDDNTNLIAVQEMVKTLEQDLVAGVAQINGINLHFFPAGSAVEPLLRKLWPELNVISRILNPTQQPYFLVLAGNHNLFALNRRHYLGHRSKR